MRQQRWLGPAMFIPAILYIVILVGVPFVMGGVERVDASRLVGCVHVRR